VDGAITSGPLNSPALNFWSPSVVPPAHRRHAVRAARVRRGPNAGDSASPVIQAVAIRRNDVFDSTEAHNWLTRLANRLHITTRESVVRREVLLHPGQAYDSAAAAETRETFGPWHLPAGGVEYGARGFRPDAPGRDLRWLEHGAPITGSRARWPGGLHIAFIEDNVWAQQPRLPSAIATRRTGPAPPSASCSRGSSGPAPAGDHFPGSLRWPRFAALVGKPFYSQASANSLLFLFDDRNERCSFLRGRAVARDSLRRTTSCCGRGGHRAWRSDRGYLRGGLTAQARKDRYRRESASSF
jgi:hypothetical protein